MKLWLSILFGGALGTGCRYGVSLLVNAWLGTKVFPWATFAINVTGSFLIGLIAELYHEQIFTSAVWRLALVTGLLGGFTTFSAFSLENLQLIRNGAVGLALAYAVGSVVLGVSAAWLGMRAGQFCAS
ncbi:MAG: fluoride efflux transporter CrcB [Acidobacteria bacterium]|nr:fluoride efflux transporter CrcB [Acidobacteriota bacterium]